MTDQKGFDIYVIFTMKLCVLKLWEMLIALLFQVFLVSNQIQRLREATESWPTNFGFLTYQTKKLKPQRIMVENYKNQTTSGLPSSA